MTVTQTRAIGPTYLVILAVSVCHLLNDLMQSVLAAIYPLLRAEFALAFWQIGLLTLAFQATASLIQPLVGLYTDRHPLPQSLPIGMGASLCGLILLASAGSYAMLIAGASLIGIGWAVFHPEASRVARLAAGADPGPKQGAAPRRGGGGMTALLDRRAFPSISTGFGRFRRSRPLDRPR